MIIYAIIAITYVCYIKEKRMFKRKRPQSEIFSSFGWWNKGCFLYQMTGDRCDYIESCITRGFGKAALAQQEILDAARGGGLICEELAQRQTIMIGIDPARSARETGRPNAQS